jgi:hypothetical protein
MENNISETAFINGTGKVHFNKKITLSFRTINYDFNKFYYKEIIKLLLNIFEETISLSDLKVYCMYSFWPDGLHSMDKFKEDNLLNTSISNAYIEFEYNNVFYIANFKIEKDRNENHHYYMDFSYEKNSIPEQKIGHELLRLAFINTSTYKKGCIEISHLGDKEVISNLEVTKIEPPKSNINKIFIDENIKNDISRFIYTFKNFDKLNFPLRYLLSGKPGLGKTEIIRTVIEQCSQYGNVIIPKKMQGVEWLIFEFARLFRPAVVCIDDIDLLFGKREEGFSKKTLGTFLTELDGIFENKIFLIATTNDKKLVDIAASRPGRFDEIIDFGDFERRYYLNLINQQTQNEEIINLFSEEIFDYMESKKVTGAFIVNLIKQLKIMIDMNPSFSKDNLMEYLQRNYKGFYKTQLKEEKTFGF